MSHLKKTKKYGEIYLFRNLLLRNGNNVHEFDLVALGKRKDGTIEITFFESKTSSEKGKSFRRLKQKEWKK